MPAKAYAFQIRTVDSVTDNGNFFFRGDSSNVSISMPPGKSVLKLAVNGGVDKYSRITWNYGSGTLVRPISNSCKFFIRY